ncbi:MAG: hypothetical protein N3D10_02665 [Candidatus Micrarchaeota archaeon]|nr:hypothetical protein [Candidatus Micrarchaeota archaeon]
MKKLNERELVLIYNEGVKNYKAQNYQKAIENFLIVFKNNNKDPQLKIALASSYNNYGVQLYKENKYQEALLMFKKASEFEPTNLQFIENIKIAQKKIKEQRLHQLTTQAYLFFQNKEYEKALKKLLTAQKLEPNEESIKKALAATYNAIGIKKYLNRKFKECIQYFELAKKTYPQNNKYEENIKIVQNVLGQKVAR